MSVYKKSQPIRSSRMVGYKETYISMSCYFIILKKVLQFFKKFMNLVYFEGFVFCIQRINADVCLLVAYTPVAQ